MMKYRIYRTGLAAAACVGLLLAASGCGQSEQPASSETTVADEAAQEAYESDMAALEEQFSSPDEIMTMSDEAFVEEALVVDKAPVSDKDAEAGGYDAFVTLGEYKGLDVTELPEGTITEEGMTVMLTYAATIGGEIVEDSRDYPISVTLGSGNSYIEGFEEGVIGHKIGENFTMPITFPEDTEGEYIDANGEFKPVAGATFDYEVSLQTGWRIMPEDALTNLTENGSKMIEYPKNIMEEARVLVEDTYASFAGEDGMDTHEFLTEVMGMTEEQIEETVYHDAKSLTVIRAILDKEGITSDSEELKAGLSAYLEEMGFSSEEEAITYGETEESLKSQAEYYAALEVLKKYASTPTEAGA